MSEEEPTVVDLFAGAGGLSNGFEQAGYDIIGALEQDETASETLKENHENGLTVYQKDIREVDAEEFRNDLVSDPEIVLGGPPCKGFSTSSGLSRDGRKRDDERNHLLWDFIRFIEVLEPDWLVMENVPGLLLYNNGEVAKEVIKALRQSGYYAVPVILLAADFGVPQLRRRLFFVANKQGENVPLPDPTHGDNDLWDDFALPFEHLSRVGNKNVMEGVKPHVSFEDACSDLPSLKPGEHYEGPYPEEPQNDYQARMREGSDKLTMHSAHDSSDFVKKAIKHIDNGENWNALPEEIKEGTRYENIREYDATTVLKRIHPDDSSYTIGTKFYDATAGAYIHPTENRTFSLREAARLQSFKDKFVFKGSDAQIREQIGNAVPPLLAKRIAEAILPYTSSPVDEAPIDHMLVDPDQHPKALIGLKDEEIESDSGNNRELSEFN